MLPSLPEELPKAPPQPINLNINAAHMPVFNLDAAPPQLPPHMQMRRNDASLQYQSLSHQPGEPPPYPPMPLELAKAAQHVESCPRFPPQLSEAPTPAERAWPLPVPMPVLAPTRSFNPQLPTRIYEPMQAAERFPNLPPQLLEAASAFEQFHGVPPQLNEGAFQPVIQPPVPANFSEMTHEVDQHMRLHPPQMAEPMNHMDFIPHRMPPQLPEGGHVAQQLVQGQEQHIAQEWQQRQQQAQHMHWQQQTQMLQQQQQPQQQQDFDIVHAQLPEGMQSQAEAQAQARMERDNWQPQLPLHLPQLAPHYQSQYSGWQPLPEQLQLQAAAAADWESGGGGIVHSFR